MKNLETLFSNIPSDEDTLILKSDYKSANDIPILIQTWNFDGIVASSAIVPNSFVANLEDEHLLKILRTKVCISNDYVIKKSGDYVFVNYGFMTDTV